MHLQPEVNQGSLSIALGEENVTDDAKKLHTEVFQLSVKMKCELSTG